MQLNVRAFAVFFLMIVFYQCKKDQKIAYEETTPAVVPDSGSVSLLFSALTDSGPLIYGNKFTNLNKDTIRVSMFKYFISNVVLIRENGQRFVVPDCYHVIDHGVLFKKSFTLSHVPVGNYKGLEFMLGVDSARNRSGAQTGGLDPAGEAANMFWTWNSGYIMLKLEGTSPQSGSGSKTIVYHIGGYGGVNKTQRIFKLNFNQNAVVYKGTMPKIYFNSKITEFFKNPDTIKVSSTYDVASAGIMAKKLSDNYADMITFDHLIN